MSVRFEDYDLVIFDLDNTLYDENLYLFKGYLDIARYLSNKYSHIPFLECKMYLEVTFQREGRKFLFDKLFNKYKIVDELEDCLKLMREVTFDSKIKLFKTSYLLLKDAINSSKVCVLTNGNPTQQKNKIRQIEWEGLLDDINIVFANEYAPKPSAKVFEDYLLPKYNLISKKILFIGDDISDKSFSQGIGCQFINIEKFKINNDNFYFL